jgi:CRP/FNR family transcriptional regulator, cyclic AMP receptor protein
VFSHEVASLQRTAMFREVEIGKLKLIAMAGQTLHYAKGDVILRQGERASMVCVLMQGEADVMRETDGKQVRLTTVGAGDLVGEIGVVLDQPYSGTIIATSPVIALQIDKVTFLDLLKQVPQLSMAVIRELSRRVVAASDRYVKAVS